MRKGEILNLKWNDINLQTSRALLQATKNGERRVVFLQNYALELLKQHAEKFGFKSPFVFPNQLDNGGIDIDEACSMTFVIAQPPILP